MRARLTASSYSPAHKNSGHYRRKSGQSNDYPYRSVVPPMLVELFFQCIVFLTLVGYGRAHMRGGVDDVAMQAVHRVAEGGKSRIEGV